MDTLERRLREETGSFPADATEETLPIRGAPVPPPEEATEATHPTPSPSGPDVSEPKTVIEEILPDLEEPEDDPETAPPNEPVLGNERAKRKIGHLLADPTVPTAVGLVLGETGLGKSRLGWEIPHLLGADRFVVVRIRGDRAGGKPELLTPAIETLLSIAEHRHPQWLAKTAASWAGPLISLAPATAGRRGGAGAGPGAV